MVSKYTVKVRRVDAEMCKHTRVHRGAGQHFASRLKHSTTLCSEETADPVERNNQTSWFSFVPCYSFLRLCTFYTL